MKLQHHTPTTPMERRDECTRVRLDEADVEMEKRTTLQESIWNRDSTPSCWPSMRGAREVGCVDTVVGICGCLLGSAKCAPRYRNPYGIGIQPTSFGSQLVKLAGVQPAGGNEGEVEGG